jgi:peptidoglycan/xylan/chitin deacetylase (PgdA/CDA1 family)
MVDRLLAASISRQMVRIRSRGRRLILAYHNVRPDGVEAAGERSLHIDFSRFRQQLDDITSTCRVVPLHAFLERDDDDTPQVAITFDDAYRGAVTLAATELRERGLPVTIFVAPALLGDRSFWWDRAAQGFPEGVMPFELRDEALFKCAGSERLVHGAFSQRGFKSMGVALPPIFRSATVEEIREAARASTLTIGSHSWSHPNLAALDRTALEDEMAHSFAWIREHFSASAIPWISYPYGIDSEDVRAGVSASGYAAAVRVDGGWLARNAVAGSMTPRVNVPAGIGRGRFRSYLANFLLG